MRLLLAVMVLAGSVRADEFRVVVQDGFAAAADVTSDGRWAVAWAHPRSEPVSGIHLLDVQRRRIAATLHLAAPARSLAIDAAGRRIAISFDGHIEIVSAVDGRKLQVIPDATGAVAFDDTGSRLAVHGTFSVDGSRKLSDARRGPYAQTALGVYDLSKKAWAEWCRSAAQVQLTAAFDTDGNAVGGGRGGQPFHHVAWSYPLHIVLDAQTKRGVCDRGPASGPGLRNAKVEAPSEPPWPEVRHHKSYKPHAALLAVPARGRETPVEFAHRRVRKLPGPAIAASPEGVACLVTRWEKDGKREHRASFLLRVTVKDVAVSAKAPKPHPAWLWRGGFVVPRNAGEPVPDHLDLAALPDGRPLMSIPGAREHTALCLFVPGAALVSDRTGITRYDLPKGNQAWLQAVDVQNEPPRFSGDRRLLAVHCVEDGEECVLVLDTRSGDARARFAVGPGAQHWTRPLGFDAKAGTLLLGHSNGYQVRLVRLSDGKELCRSKPAPAQEIGSNDRAFPATDGSWIVTDFRRTRTLWPDGRWDASIPIANVREVVPLPGGRMLLRAEHLQCTLEQATDNVTAMTSANGDAVIAFGGRYLVRSRGAPQQIEFLDAASGALRLTIHTLAEDWIAFTPDGRWDASTGSDSRVAVYRGHEPVDPATRRSKGLVRGVLGNR